MQTRKKERRVPLNYPEWLSSEKPSTEQTVRYIRQFDKMNGLKSGSTYIIHGKEVVV